MGPKPDTKCVLSFWTEALGSIDTNGLAVQVVVDRDLPHERGVLFRATHPLWKWHASTPASLCLLLGKAERRSEKRSRSDAHDPHPERGEIASSCQGEAHNPSFRGRIGRLSNLAFVGSNRCRIDDHPTRSIIQLGILSHGGGDKS